MKASIIPFIRTEDGSVSTVALLRVHTEGGVSQSTIVEALRKAVTAWVETTQAGGQLWRESSRDLNIGDLASADALRDADLIGLLEREGLSAVELIEACETAESVSFDMVLASPAGAVDEEPEPSDDDGPVALQRYTLHTTPNGAIEGRVFTNDDQDLGYPTTSAEWDVRYRDHDDMLKRTGGTHVGISGVRVEVVLDGNTVPAS